MVIHNGVNHERYCADPAVRGRVRQELGVGDDEFCIGSVGNLTPVKDHMTELRALAEFAKTAGPWRFVLIGDGPERASLQTFVDSHPEWKGRVVFTGLTRRVPELLNAMDVFTLPSVTEGICNSLLEAMATGLPVIATDTGGNPEVVVDGTCGFLFPIGDHRQLANRLLTLYRDCKLRSRLGRQAVERMRTEFSFASMVSRYEHLYRSVQSVRREFSTGIVGA
jgi:glycosyltransferase involved in cell wall biosynthesis